MSAMPDQPSSGSSEMHHAMYEALARERMQVHDQQVRQAYLRKLAALRRRQRKVDAARRALQARSVI
jgi:hypothetical protein